VDEGVGAHLADVQLEVGLDGDQHIAGVDLADEGTQHRGLARTHAPGDEDRQVGCHGGAQEGQTGVVEATAVDQ
jgi:hypothetical protein